MTRRRRALLLAVVGLGALVPATSWGADAGEGGFVATASAQGGRLTFTVPGFVLVSEVVDGGGPVSHAVVDSLGAKSFASLPYPGENAIAFPGLFSTVTGQPPPPGWPFYVDASHPTKPEQKLEDPTGSYRLAAVAAEGQASGSSQLAGEAGEGEQSGSGGSRTQASVVQEAGKVTALAETRNEAINLGQGALRLASVRSRSRTTYSPGQSPVTETELVVEGGSAGGHSFTYGPQGLAVADQGIPLPAGAGLEQLNKALQPAGISIRFAGSQSLVGGASADALEISMRQEASDPGVPGRTVTLRLGGATTSAAAGEGLAPLPETPLEFGDDAASPPAGGDGPPTPEPVTALEGETTALPETGSFGLASPADAGAAALAAADTPVSPEAAVSAAPQFILRPRRLGADGLVYGILVTAGVVMLVLSSLWRKKGVLRI